ncbi:MAG: 3-isopropylmalate/(R)-2-methylmalate dehydratase small subunit [Crocinitomix sp.]|jgi:3-isopropylmalate/(R)-2-methylmalate dehydratase small subunit
MKREKVGIINSAVVPLPIANIDTDQIIPARFLKATDRKGFGENLFRDWRYSENGIPKTNFALNDTTYQGSILLAGDNFGCGSSREHAAWALYDYGFRVIIAPSFADIFKENALNNGLLPVEVSQELCDTILKETVADPFTKIQVSLVDQEVRMLISGDKEFFKINAYKKTCLLNGLDDLDYLIQLREEITAFEKVQNLNRVSDVAQLK